MALTIALRPYQVEIGRAVMDSVLGGKGFTFTVEIARQGGKNELSVHLELLLLTMSLAGGGTIVKAAPTFRPQTLISQRRLMERLDQAGFAGFWKKEHGQAIRLGRARALFLSADRSASVVGNTASLLLEVDEAQDVDADKFNKDFRPMAAATNATTVLYGTAWDDASLLEEVKRRNLELEAGDGVRRHFEYPWQEVARHNPHYLSFVEGERQRLGEEHPLFLTQYCLRPVSGGGGFLSPGQLAQLQGDHPRQHRPSPGVVYVAGVDLAGEAEEGQDELVREQQPRRDSTVVTVAALDFSHPVLGEPSIFIMEHCWWTGRPHPELYAALADVLRVVWGCRRVVVDATGVGAGVASFLARSLGPGVAVPFTFTAPAKSHLGFDLLSAVNSGRLKMYAADGSPECGEFWQEAGQARCNYRSGRNLNFFVEPSRGHDDFLISLALTVAAAAYRPR
ncbi:MAG: hypothetical protein V3U31_07735, partial [Dehalococcoidia bacterium]